MTPSNIQAGFEVTGIFPFNRFRISDDNFLPAAVTDRPDPSIPSESVALASTSVDLINKGQFIASDSTTEPQCCMASTPERHQLEHTGIDVI